MPYNNTRELKEDVLFRASEPIGGASQWEAKVIDYINREYQTLCTGTNEFLPEYNDDWWWTRGEGVFLLEPAYLSGTVALTKGSTSGSFSIPPASSMQGRRLKVTNQPDIPLIASHTGGAGPFTLDAAWTGDTLPTASFKAMKTDYVLSGSAQALISPIIVFGQPYQIVGISPERMDVLHPLALLDTGVPQAFALLDDSTVRFSHGGSSTGFQYRLEYRYRKVIAALTDSTGSIPLVPAQYRQVLADMALVFVLLDKNDDRSNAVALAARTLLAAMLKDNRRRNVKVDTRAGHVYPRPLNRRSVRTGR